jgi:hypothetical protein
LWCSCSTQRGAGRAAELKALSAAVGPAREESDWAEEQQVLDEEATDMALEALQVR